MVRPLAISTFSGIGGLDLGAESSGFKIGLAIEKDPIIASMHKYNFPDTIVLCEDATQIDCDRIISELLQIGERRRISLLLFTAPCQSFSMLGARKEHDPRNNLVFELIRYLQQIKPQYFIFENVPSINYGKLWETIYVPLLEEIKDCSYQAMPIILDAANYKIAQRRKRLFIVGWRDGEKAIDLEYSELDKLTSEITVKDAIADLGEIFPYTKQDLGTETAILNYNDYRKNFSYPPSGIFSYCDLRKFNYITYGHIVPNHTEQVRQRFANVKPGLKDVISHAVRLSEHSISPTLTAGTSADRGSFSSLKPIHYCHPRAISVREFARLMAFPDWFQLNLSKSHACRGLGNAVCPPIGKFLCDRIIQALGVSPLEIISEIKELQFPDAQLLEFKPQEAQRYFDDFS